MRRFRTQLVRTLAVIACGAAIPACTYDFDQFVGPTNSASSGGTGATTSQGGSATGTGATTSQGGSATGTGGYTSSSGGAGAVIATGGISSVASTPACAGAAYGGICWYLGASAASCDQVCAAHGQSAPGMASYVGTQAQGGSVEECATLLSLLGVTQAPTSGTRSDGLGLGCHLFQNVPWWLSSPSFSTSASGATARRVCGCTQ